MAELYAACRADDVFAIKRVMLTNDLQDQVENVFRVQEDQFLDGIDNEIEFTGSWKPDPDEILTVANLPDAILLRDAIRLNPVALEEIDAANFEDEAIKALIAVVGPAQNRRALIQSFSPQQLLARKFSLFFQDGVFRKLEDPGFSLDTKLVAVMDRAGVLKFKTYHLVRRIFDLSEVYRDATDAEIGEFCDLACLRVGDVAEFVENADEGIRKLIHAVSAEEVLANYSVAQIRSKARSIGFGVAVRAGRLVVPDNRKDRKQFLSFLLNKVYEGPITQQLFITNSNRRI